MLGLNELLIVGIVAVFLFGATKVVSWAKAMGTAKKAYEEASKSEDKNSK